MKIGVAYATPAKQIWLNIDVPEGATVKDAIEKSGILKQFPEIDLASQKVGIYGKATTLETVVEEGARVEIYRPMTADPKTVPRRAKTGGEAASEG
ncbi:MAG: RnfH family protein [Rhodospirillales bacterium]|nr:RnfH family protein [Rhodospirillales bacterium]